MPFKSKAQRRKFAELLVNGKISPEVYEEWNRETGRADLPERVRPKPGMKTTRARKTSGAGKTARGAGAGKSGPRAKSSKGAKSKRRPAPR
jgi:hypothetical protein